MTNRPKSDQMYRFDTIPYPSKINKTSRCSIIDELYQFKNHYNAVEIKTDEYRLIYVFCDKLEYVRPNIVENFTMTGICKKGQSNLFDCIIKTECNTIIINNVEKIINTEKELHDAFTD